MPPWWYSSPYLQTHWRFPRLFGVFPLWNATRILRSEPNDIRLRLGVWHSSAINSHQTFQGSKHLQRKKTWLQRKWWTYEMMSLENPVNFDSGWIMIWYISPTSSYLKVPPPFCTEFPGLHYLLESMFSMDSPSNWTVSMSLCKKKNFSKYRGNCTMWSKMYPTLPIP